MIESDTAYIIPRLDATLLEMMVESNSVEGITNSSISIIVPLKNLTHIYNAVIKERAFGYRIYRRHWSSDRR